MAIILVSQGVPLHPDHEADLRAIQARANELRLNADHFEGHGQTIQAKEARSMANVLECLIEPRSTSSDPMGAVADALRDQTEARAEDEVLKQQEHMCNCVPDEECCGGESDE